MEVVCLDAFENHRRVKYELAPFVLVLSHMLLLLEEKGLRPILIFKRKGLG
jgi:hypothetical protein